MIKSLLSKQTKAIYKPPLKEIVFPHIDVPDVGWMHQIDILHLPNDDGFKYLLTAIDVYDSSCDAIALKTMDMPTVIHAMNTMYENSMSLVQPKLIQVDQQFDNKYFKDWCDENEINYKFTLTNRHRQNAHVERLNKTLGTWIWEIQVNKELETGKENNEWHGIYRKLIDILNTEHRKRKHKELPDKIIINKNNNKLIAPNTKVRLVIQKDDPQTIRGDKLHGTLRAGDPKWHAQPIYQVVAPILTPNQPPMYQIRNMKTGRIVNTSFPFESLQVI